MPITVKRIYDPSSKDDGVRILVDRLWPRGVSKQRANVDRWEREVAPSIELRKWFDHDPEKWVDFKRRYFAELREHEGVLRPILEEAEYSNVTLLFAAKDAEFNNAVALEAYIVQLAK